MGIKPITPTAWRLEVEVADLLDDEQSVVLLEEPQPVANRRVIAGLRAELLIGVVLVLGIAGWSLWSWWNSQDQLGKYRSAERYAAQYDWNAAHDAYIAAGDYGDAANKALSAAANITRRDESYDAALREVGASAWAAALRELRVVQEIAPNFRDSASLHAQAEQQVYSGALGGSVVRRIAANPAGLYAYRPGGWAWLEGSDAKSTVLGSGQGCYAIYDVADETIVVPGTPPADQPISRDAQTMVMDGRRVMVARQEGDKLVSLPVGLSPSRFSSFSCSEKGIIATAYRNPPDNISNDTRLQLAGSYFSNLDIMFQAFGSTVASSLQLPGPAWLLLHMGQNGNGFVLGDYSFNSAENPRTDIYLADETGKRSLVATRDAIVQNAVLSPDGKYLLLDELSLGAGGKGDEHRVVDVFVDKRRSPVILRRWADDPPLANGWFWLSFVQSGAYAGKALVSGSSPWDSAVILLDPAQPKTILWTTTTPENEQLATIYSLQSGFLLSWMDSGRSRIVRAMYLDQNGAEKPLDLGLGPTSWPDQMWQSGDRLIYSIFSTDAAVMPQLEIRSMSLDQPNSGTIELEIIPLDYQSQIPSPGPSWYLGPSLFATVRNGELHCITYDGSVDLLLESGVENIYHLSQPQ